MIKALIGRIWRATPSLLLVSLFINVLALTSPIYMIQLYDRVLSSLQVETLILLTLMAAIALAVYGALEALRGAMLSRMGIWVERAAGEAVVEGSIQAMLEDDPSGAQPVRDLESIKMFVIGHLKTLLDLPFSPIFFLAAFILHPWIGWLTLGAAIVLALFAFLNDRLTRRGISVHSEANLHSQIVLENSLRNAETIRAMGMDKNVIARWQNSQGAALGQQLAAADVSSTFMGLTRFVRMFSQAAVLGMGAYLVIQGELSVGLIIAGSIILGRALAPIDQFLTAWRSFAETRVAYKRLVELDKRLPPLKVSPMVHVAGKIEVEGLAYRPQENAELILKDIRFSVMPGEIMVIAGPSGAGKSTIAKLITGAREPTAGRILLDGTYLSQWDNVQLGSKIGYLPQSVELFPGTILENIARMSVKPDLAKAEAAAKAAGVHDLIVTLPDNYHTQLGPGGGFLSGGQRQRVGLARALYGQPNLIVLDEPNANLDSTGEAKLIAAVQTARDWNASVIMIGHTPSLLRVADTVLVVVKGEAQMFGPAADVLDKIAQPTAQNDEQDAQPPASLPKFIRTDT